MLTEDIKARKNCLSFFFQTCLVCLSVSSCALGTLLDREKNRENTRKTGGGERGVGGRERGGEGVGGRGGAAMERPETLNLAPLSAIRYATSFLCSEDNN